MPTTKYLNSSPGNKDTGWKHWWPYQFCWQSKTTKMQAPHASPFEIWHQASVSSQHPRRSQRLSVTLRAIMVAHSSHKFMSSSFPLKSLHSFPKKCTNLSLSTAWLVGCYMLCQPPHCTWYHHLYTTKWWLVTRKAVCLLHYNSSLGILMRQHHDNL